MGHNVNEELINHAIESISETKLYRINEVTVSAHHNPSGTRTLSVEIEFDDSQLFINTKDGGMYVPN